MTVWRMAGWVVLAAVGLTGCSTQMLGSVAAAAAASVSGTPSETAQERAEQQMLASVSAAPEKFPNLETEQTYLQVIAQLQRKQLWFAALAHLEVLESRWKPSDDSRLLRADSLRQIGQRTESAALYQRLLDGPKAASARHGLGLLAAQEGRFNDAVVQLESARLLAPTDALLLNDLGYALLYTEHAESARIPLMQAAQLLHTHPRIQSNVALFLLLYESGEQASAWMAGHQMSEAARLQVFEQVQRLSMHAPAAAQQPVVFAANAAGKTPAPTPTITPVAALAASPQPTVWMTETSVSGERP